MIGLNYLGKMGQLGNQMFQYAALKGIASWNGYEYIFPNHNEAIKDGLGNVLRIELFDAFDIKHSKYGFVRTNRNIQEEHFCMTQDLQEGSDIHNVVIIEHYIIILISKTISTTLKLSS